jgi:hypothetical protein
LNNLDILQKNKTLKNKHAAKRCFIIGNGPSIVDQDLLLLKDDIKICLNDFYNHPQCKEIGPDYWMTADPNYWHEKDRLLVPLLEALESNRILTRLFFPTAGSIKVERSYYLNIHYFSYDAGARQLNEAIDFCKEIPPFAQNVMLVGLMLAFYMGCNPIFLIGADHSWWAWQRDEYAGKNNPHFYKDKNDYSPISERYSYDLLQSTIYVQRYQYLQLINYAQRRGFDIYNATPGGELDLFPRIEYESLFPGGMRMASVQDFLSRQPHLAGQLGGAAQKMIQEGQYATALVLIDEALRHNINRSEKILGLNYLRALCLNGLGFIREAINEARYEYINNPGNRENAVCLLENMGDPFPFQQQKAM